MRSRGITARDRVHRRRECAGCGERFPTSERVDRELLAYELELRGAAPPPVLDAGGPSAVTRRDAVILLARIRTNAIDGEVVTSDFDALAVFLASLR